MNPTHETQAATSMSSTDQEFEAFVEANLATCVEAIAHLHKHGVLPAGALRLQLRHLDARKGVNALPYAEGVVSHILIARVAGGDYLQTLPIDTAPTDGTVVVVDDTTGMTQWCEAKYTANDQWEGWIYTDDVCNDTNPGGPLPTSWILPRPK